MYHMLSLSCLRILEMDLILGTTAAGPAVGFPNPGGILGPCTTRGVVRSRVPPGWGGCLGWVWRAWGVCGWGGRYGIVRLLFSIRQLDKSLAFLVHGLWVDCHLPRRIADGTSTGLAAGADCLLKTRSFVCWLLQHR